MENIKSYYGVHYACINGNFEVYTTDDEEIITKNEQRVKNICKQNFIANIEQNNGVPVVYTLSKNIFNKTYFITADNHYTEDFFEAEWYESRNDLFYDLKTMLDINNITITEHNLKNIYYLIEK
jgi:hypothetical protein